MVLSVRNRMLLLAEAAHPLPTQFEELDALTPVGAIYRYEDYEAPVSLDRCGAQNSTIVAPLGGGQD